jgi:hypothetical protein
MALLTEALIAKRHSVPVALALTLLKKGDWIVLNTVKLSATMTFTFRFLQLQCTDLTVEGSTTGTVTEGGQCDCSEPEPELINPSNGLAYVAIYRNYAINTDPVSLTAVGTSVDLVSVTEAASIASRDLTKPELVINETANFTFLLVNNTSNADLRLSVNGEVTISL